MLYSRLVDLDKTLLRSRLHAGIQTHPTTAWVKCGNNQITSTGWAQAFFWEPPLKKETLDYNALTRPES